MTFYSWTGFNGSLADGTEVKPDGSLVRPDGTVVTAADVEAAGGLEAWIKANIAPDGEATS